MTKRQRQEHKQGNAKRRAWILAVSYKQRDGNLCRYLGGVGQKSKYS